MTLSVKETEPCKYKSCVSFSTTKSRLGYCSIHDLVANDPNTHQLALKGQLSAGLRTFAEDLDKGAYPKGF